MGAPPPQQKPPTKCMTAPTLPLPPDPSTCLSALPPLLELASSVFSSLASSFYPADSKSTTTASPRDTAHSGTLTLMISRRSPIMVTHKPLPSPTVSIDLNLGFNLI